MRDGSFPENWVMTRSHFVRKFIWPTKHERREHTAARILFDTSFFTRLEANERDSTWVSCLSLRRVPQRCALQVHAHMMFGIVVFVRNLYESQNSVHSIWNNHNTEKIGKVNVWGQTGREGGRFVGFVSVMLFTIYTHLSHYHTPVYYVRQYTGIPYPPWTTMEQTRIEHQYVPGR